MNNEHQTDTQKTGEKKQAWGSDSPFFEGMLPIYFKSPVLTGKPTLTRGRKRSGAGHWNMSMKSLTNVLAIRHKEHTKHMKNNHFQSIKEYRYAQKNLMWSKTKQIKGIYQFSSPANLQFCESAILWEHRLYNNRNLTNDHSFILKDKILHLCFVSGRLAKYSKSGTCFVTKYAPSSKQTLKKRRQTKKI